MLSEKGEVSQCGGVANGIVDEDQVGRVRLRYSD